MNKRDSMEADFLKRLSELEALIDETAKLLAVPLTGNNGCESARDAAVGRHLNRSTGASDEIRVTEAKEALGFAANFARLSREKYECHGVGEALGWFMLSSVAFGAARGMMDKDRFNSETRKLWADIQHSKPGGSRDKRKQICDAWASGKYSSRDLCAEQECAALEMSFSTARKALRNTPNPT